MRLPLSLLGGQRKWERERELDVSFSGRQNAEMDGKYQPILILCYLSNSP